MAIKTFNPNRTVGGTFSLVRAADGTYSVKENGFESLGVLNLPELSDSAVTTTATKTDTAADIIDTTVEDQTKKAFELPKPDDNNNQFTTEKMLKSATDVSKSLSDFETVSDKQKEESQLGLGRDRINPFDRDDFDTGVDQFTGTGIRAPDRIFRSDTERFKTEFDPTVTSPQEKLKVTSANVQKGLVEAPLKKDLTDLYNKYVAGDRTKIDTEKGSEVVQGGMPGDIERRQRGQLGSLGIKADPSAVELGEMKTTAPFPGRSRTIGGLKVEAPAPLAIDEGAVQLGEMNTTTAKKTFSESINTALKGFKTPMMELVEGVANIGVSPAQQRLNSLNKSSLAAAGYKTRGELGSSIDPGRIAGNPAENVFAGMNAQSARGNIMTASRNRIDTINNSAAKARAKGDIAKAERMEAKANKFEKQRNEMLAEQEKKQAEINKATMNQGPPGQDDRNAGGKIVCTMMNESYGFGSFRNKIWMKFHKDLSPEYQRGYHRLFLPLIKIAKKNKIIKNILEHIAVHSTIDMRQSMRGKKHLLGRVYSKILLPICYWAGKK